MSDSEKPKSWKELSQLITHKWQAPFIYWIEWPCEWISYWLGQWALLEICGHIGRFGVLVSIIVGLCVYVMEADERRMQAENERQQAVDQRKAKRYQAWQVIIAAQGKQSSGGRKDALEDLHKDKVPLVGVDISKAYLLKLNLVEAELYGANLKSIDRWQKIKSIEHAEIYGIRNPPVGFIEWAKEQGAVNFEDDEKWKKLKREKRQEKTKEKQ